TAPVNRFAAPLLALSGIVETGSYYKEVQLPMACLLTPGQAFDMPCGSPMIQVIPMRREAWTSGVERLDDSRRQEQQSVFDTELHAYKGRFWRKLQFE